MVRAAGYRLATGDEADIPEGADPRIVVAALERGWGDTFVVTTRDREPLQGVELLVDGTSVGLSDVQGMLSINLAAKPRALEFRYKDWMVNWGRVDPSAEDFGWGPETPVYMGPPK